MTDPGKPITIIGGGLAGLTLGIGLRQRAVPVTVWEAGSYPRHRVCGEFISGNGLAVLRRLGLLADLEKAGGYYSETVMFISGPNRSPVRRLAAPALCLSRYAMDALLAGHFRRLGGELRENTRGSAHTADGIVHASGRRTQPTENGWRWFGLKAHARNVDLAADLEMHITSSGYVGVNRIDHGEVNVCGLFRSRPGETAVESRLQRLRGLPGSPLRQRLAGAVFDESTLCSVAGLSLIPRHAAEREACCIGDALTLIPPVTGNGMSMAFESAEAALEPLAAFSRGERDWKAARQAVARACDAAFARRLTWARRLQWLLFSPWLRSRFGRPLLRSERLWRLLFERTR